MSISTPFIERPIATTLLTIAVALAGGIAYQFLPVSPLPTVDFPTISVSAGLPGASPETMASSVATPLERQFGRIAGISEMTSSSSLGATSITLQFDLNRNIDAAGRDVQAAINAARGQLPANLPSNPFYRKVNPADAPILLMALTSDLIDRGKIYDLASSILQQKLSQVPGVGQVIVGGGALPAVRVDVNPTALNNNGLSLEDVRNALSNANANRPKGELGNIVHTWSLSTSDQLLKAAEYQPLIVTYHNGAAVRLADISSVTDSVEDIRTGGLTNGKPAVIIIIFRQPGANIIDTVNHVRAVIPQLKASVPPSINLDVIIDATRTIRASVRDVEVTLVISILLVIGVVFVFLRNLRATLIPSVAVPVSLIGTFGVMYLLGYSIDNLSLMALTIATGFVVDDAIVVIENITRHLENGMQPYEAALQGAQEIGFTVMSISISLIAVFIPILMMGGIVGRLFREFAVTLSIAILVSLVISLTTTPMMCARLLKAHSDEKHGRLYDASEKAFDWVQSGYRRSLSWVLRHQPLTLLVTALTMAATVYLYIIVPKGFFPQQDTGRLNGAIQADQDTSFQAMKRRMAALVAIVSKDPAVESTTAFIGGQAVNTGRVFVGLKAEGDRGKGHPTADQVIGRLRPKLAKVPGVSLILQPVQDLRIGGRASAAQYQYTLQGDNTDELLQWAPKVLNRLRTLPILTDVNTDQQNKGLEASLAIDRTTAARLGISTQTIDDTLYDAFGQRQVSTMYQALNQYHVVMEVEPDYWQNPDGLKYIYAKSAGLTNSAAATAAATTNGTVSTSSAGGTTTGTTGATGSAAGTTAGTATAAGANGGSGGSGGGSTAPSVLPSATGSAAVVPTFANFDTSSGSSSSSASTGASASDTSTGATGATGADTAGSAAGGSTGATDTSAASSSTSASAGGASAAGGVTGGFSGGVSASGLAGSSGGGGGGSAATAKAAAVAGLVPLSAFTHYKASTAPLTINHSAQFPSVTISFNLPPGVALGTAVTAIEQAERAMGVPSDIRGSFQGTAQAFQASLANEPVLIAAALLAVYIVLGVLYESYIHPITILSTLPSAGVGALVALIITHTDLSVIALIGIILLIGIVKKNAILMIDFAIELERNEEKTPEESIFEACLLRFRPITMTTMAALLGGLPLAIGLGTGSELRRPLGIAIVGGLLFSQALTLYTTPVVYLYLDRFQIWWKRVRGHRGKHRGTASHPAPQEARG